MSRTFPLGDHRALLAPLNAESYSDPAQIDAAWTDVFGDVNEGVGAASLVNDPFRDTPVRILCMSHNANDSLSFYFQFPHGWDKGQVHPHVHFLPLANPAIAENIRWSGQYAWSVANDPLGNALPANAGWTSFVADVVVNPGDVYKQKIASFPYIDPPAFAKVESAVLVLQFFRLGNDGADTYTTNKDHGTPAANVGLLSIDVHMQQEKLGTASELPHVG